MAHNVTLEDAFQRINTILNAGAARTGSYDDLSDWLDEQVILRKTSTHGKKSIFVRRSRDVIKYFKANFTDSRITFSPYDYGDPKVEVDSDFVMGSVSGSARWTDAASPAPEGEKISFAFTFINEDATPTKSGDWKIIFLYGSN